MKYFKSVFLTLFAIVFVLSATNLFSQEKEKSSLNKKLSELKGKVEKITVAVDGKEVVFEGKDAENLAKRMRSGGISTFNYSVGRGSGAGAGTGKRKGYRIITRDGEDLEDSDADVENVVLSLSKSGDDAAEVKNIKVEKVDGKTKMTIIETDKDGKETEKTLEGEDAEKYMKENSDGVIMLSRKNGSHNVPMRFKVRSARPSRTVIIEKDEDSDNDDAEATVYITKSDKAKKDVVIKKKKDDLKKENKEDK